MNEENKYTHIAISATLFQKIFNLISNMSYNQVAGLIKEIETEAQGISLEETAKEEKEEPKKSKTYAKK